MLESAASLEPIMDGEGVADQVAVTEDGEASSEEVSETEGLVSPGR